MGLQREFSASTIEDAHALAEESLGRNYQIIETREEQSGFFQKLRGRKTFTVVASYAESATNGKADTQRVREMLSDLGEQGLGELILNRVGKLDSALSLLQYDMDGLTPQMNHLIDLVAAMQVSVERTERMVALNHEREYPIDRNYSEGLKRWRDTLFRRGVQLHHAEEILRQLVKTLEDPRHASAELVRERLEEWIADKCPSFAPPRARRGGSRGGPPLVKFLIGPTGVGKTSTLGKLAHFHKTQGAKVMLIGADHYRLGAHRQVEEYASALNVEAECIKNPDRISERIQENSDHDLFLVDVPGISYGGLSTAENEFVGRIIKSIKEQEQREVHLLLSVNTAFREMIMVSRFFAAFQPDCVLFTKLDESTSPGVMLSYLLEAKLPVSFFTDGQDALDHLHQARSAELIDRVLGSLGEKPADERSTDGDPH